MIIRKFQIDRDFSKLESYLREQYKQNRSTISWLPERLHDLVYRVSAHEKDNGLGLSMDYIFMWEEQGEIIACILPDGENIYFSLKPGWEQLFAALLAFSEENCRPLFHKADDGSVKFWTAVSGKLTYMHEILIASGYQRYADKAYDSVVYPQDSTIDIELPNGFRLIYGEEYVNEENKWAAHHLGFHPDDEETDFTNSMNPYNLRKHSAIYPDSFECMVIDKNAEGENDVCSYCFVYVDRKSGTAMIEPVSTREKYRRMGIGSAMIKGAVLRCKELGIEKCYVDSFGWREKFYTAAGFTTEDSTVFWYKTLSV